MSQYDSIIILRSSNPQRNQRKFLVDGNDGKSPMTFQAYKMLLARDDKELESMLKNARREAALSNETLSIVYNGSSKYIPNYVSPFVRQKSAHSANVTPLSPRKDFGKQSVFHTISLPLQKPGVHCRSALSAPPETKVKREGPSKIVSKALACPYTHDPSV